MAEFEASQVCRGFIQQLQNEVGEQDRQLQAYMEQGNLLPFYLDLNSAARLDQITEQWRVFFRTRFPSGLDRARVAMWEVRNLHMAATIRKITALNPGGRMLVIVGAAHKPFLDAYLHSLADIELVHLADLQ
ncbi:MAG TPA: hypothetical protein DGR79_05480 [Clostridiales bacterium]|nr:hypothetical protein [Clostridiales bacterium]